MHPNIRVDVDKTSDDMPLLLRLTTPRSSPPFPTGHPIYVVRLVSERRGVTRSASRGQQSKQPGHGTLGERSFGSRDSEIDRARSWPVFLNSHDSVHRPNRHDVVPFRAVHEAPLGRRVRAHGTAVETDEKFSASGGGRGCIPNNLGRDD